MECFSCRRIGYSQAKACSYADPAGPLCGETGIEVRSTRGAAIENKYKIAPQPANYSRIRSIPQNCRRSGRRIGYSQAKACSYADPAGPLCGETGIEVRSTRGAAIENKYKIAPQPANYSRIRSIPQNCRRSGRRIGCSQAAPARTPIQRVPFAGYKPNGRNCDAAFFYFVRNPVRARFAQNKKTFA